MLLLIIIYIALLEIVYIVSYPILFALFRKALDCERLAIKYPHKKYDVLVHAASVGEINGIRQLLLELLKTNPELSIIITTNTKSGRIAATGLHPRIDVTLSPFDIFHLRMKQLVLTNPKLILVAETEIWPTLLIASKLKNKPIVFVNSRMSLKTFKQYLLFKPMLAFIGTNIKTICTQTEEDCIRFSSIFSAKCITTGNLKFNIEQPVYSSHELRKEWGYNPKDKIIVWGSSRPGEEKLFLDNYDSIRSEYPDIKIIIAPRHLSRIKEVIAMCVGRDVSIYSNSNTASHIHIIDKMGILLQAYALCDIAIIGGSFYPFGGHNPLEAAYYSKIIVMGPYYESCKGSVSELKKAGAIILTDKYNLEADIRQAISFEIEKNEMGIKANQVLANNQNALMNHIEIIQPYLD